jgi:excisionase family DNA binding protein
MTKLLNYRNAAEMLGLSERTVHSLKAKGMIPYIKIGKLIKFSEESLRLWLQSKEQGATT